MEGDGRLLLAPLLVGFSVAFEEYAAMKVGEDPVAEGGGVLAAKRVERCIRLQLQRWAQRVEDATAPSAREHPLAEPVEGALHEGANQDGDHDRDNPGRPGVGKPLADDDREENDRHEPLDAQVEVRGDVHQHETGLRTVECGHGTSDTMVLNESNRVNNKKVFSALWILDPKNQRFVSGTDRSFQTCLGGRGVFYTVARVLV